MSSLEVILAPSRAQAEEVVNSQEVVATVEAEYGDFCIEGTKLTLAHHGSRSHNPAPCNDPRAVELESGTVLVSHIDLDTIGGVLALMGQKIDDPEFWKAAEYIDVAGPHHMHELPQDIQDKLNAFDWAEETANRGPRVTEITNVTKVIEAKKEILDKILDEKHPEHDAIIQAGREWAKNSSREVEECLVKENENVRAFTSNGVFCSASYYSPNQDKIIPATVTQSLAMQAITVAFAEGNELQSARRIVQGLWGPEAGGRDGIGGSPRNWGKSPSELQAEFEKAAKVTELVAQSPEMAKAVLDKMELAQEMLAKYEPVWAVKAGSVLVQEVNAGVHLTTYTKNGNTEVQEEIAKEGQVMLTRVDDNGNPVIDQYGHKNQWFVDREILEKKYQMPNEKGIALPTGLPQQFITVDRDVTLMVPWGDNGQLIPQEIKAGGLINITNPTDIYGIAEEEFQGTYREAKQVSFMMGVEPGYFNGENPTPQVAQAKADEFVQKRLGEEMNHAVGGLHIEPAAAIYSRDWGCPDGGEVGVVVTGYFDPAKIDEVRHQIGLLAGDLGQSTTTVEYKMDQELTSDYIQNTYQDGPRSADTIIETKCNENGVGTHFRVELASGTIQENGAKIQEVIDTLVQTSATIDQMKLADNVDRNAEKPYMITGVLKQEGNTIVYEGTQNPMFAQDREKYEATLNAELFSAGLDVSRVEINGETQLALSPLKEEMAQALSNNGLIITGISDQAISYAPEQSESEKKIVSYEAQFIGESEKAFQTVTKVNGEIASIEKTPELVKENLDHALSNKYVSELNEGVISVKRQMSDVELQVDVNVKAQTCNIKLNGTLIADPAHNEEFQQKYDRAWTAAKEVQSALRDELTVSRSIDETLH